MHIDNMLQHKAYTVINIEIARLLNVSAADHKPCMWCRGEIRLLKKVNTKGRIVTNRDNRVDCQEGSRVETYHLGCYDLAMHGFVLSQTARRIRELEEEFGEI